MAGTAAHLFVDDLDRPELNGDDRHHLDRVLRLRAGEQVTVSDGRGGWRLCQYGGAGRVEAVGEIECDPAPLPVVTVAFALTKAGRPDWIAQKLTEVGVDQIMPVETARAVVRWEGEKRTKQVERLRTIARSAAMQSRRTWLPTVHDLQPFAAVVGDLGGLAALAERGGAPPSLSRPATLIGPEGGWTDDELASGLPRVSLGPTVLRAETAAFAAGFLLCALRARIVAPLPGG